VHRDRAGNGIDVNGLSRRPEVIAAFLADPLVHDRVSASLGVGLLDVGKTLMAQAATLRVPTLIVHGADDPVTSPRASAQFAQRARESCDHRLVPGALHEVHNEASWPATWESMTHWIDRHC
jgi:alpha-beta hydrolase superfamily lysophospholipase